jgi:hypothetical protein
LQLTTVALVFALSACRSPEAARSDTLAAVEIKGHTTMEVARTISEVFQAAGFEAVPLRPNNDLKMQFDKPGNTGDAVMYGDWSFKKVWYRARVTIKRPSENTHLVTCDAFRINEHGDPHFEEEHKLSALKRGPYQDLLDQVKARLP